MLDYSMRLQERDTRLPERKRLEWLGCCQSWQSVIFRAWQPAMLGWTTGFGQNRSFVGERERHGAEHVAKLRAWCEAFVVAVEAVDAYLDQEHRWVLD